MVAEGLRAKLGQPVIVENKPGANGVLGLRELLKAEPDGYTLMVGNLGSLVINYAIDAKASFDPMKDVVPIAGTSEYADRHGGQQQDAGEFGEGVHRLRQGAAGQAHLRLDRRRRDGLSRRRAVHAEDRHQDGARALPAAVRWR